MFFKTGVYVKKVAKVGCDIRNLACNKILSILLQREEGAVCVKFLVLE